MTFDVDRRHAGTTRPACAMHLKATGDIVLALVLLAMTGPLILVLLALVKLTSRGPAIYSQQRLGLGGRPYPIYKIRTMHHDCERATGPKWSTANDPRVTPLGRFLRKAHIDELPQLWNVVRGEMSLVGPRPERPEFVDKLARAVPAYPARMSVRPGITGLAQVQLPPDEDLSSVRRKLAYDLCYLEHMGPVLDLKILAATALKVVGYRFDLIRRVTGLPSVAESVTVEAPPKVEREPFSKFQTV
jgi:lipopolysaccharide/colanic/teichoic acid biosynthesis glycosyltransferase